MLAVQLPVIVIAIPIAPLVVSLFFVFYYFDAPIRYQHQNHFEEWEKDGKPIGIFWVPTDASLFRGGLARNYASIALLFFSKPWIESDEEAKRLRRRLQIAALVYFICFGLIFWLLNSSMHNAQ